MIVWSRWSCLSAVAAATVLLVGPGHRLSLTSAFLHQGVVGTPNHQQQLSNLVSTKLSHLLPPSSSSSSSSSLSPQLSVTQLCAAKKKRRRRKDDPDTTSSTEEELSITSTATDLVDDDAFEGNSLLQASLSSNPTTSDLPDFDLSDDPDEPSSTSTGTTKPKKKKSTQAAFGDLETITPAMIGSSDSGSVKSIDELIADRSLEQRFQFDESEVDEEIPDFVQLAARSSSSKSSSSFDPSMIGGGAGTEQIGKKKQRQAERRANAIRAREEADASKSGGGGGLFNIPFFSPDKDQVSGIKILENSAWVGIAMLILWELYLNSPFFERAAPLAPVVFESIFL